uniref:NPH3 domain-containing protein n=1 Tax=Setaria digitata TaxID=48799 RepID=A0A915Q4H0_9BILA
MTILSVVGGKGPGPIEGEEPERASRSHYHSALTAEELGFFNEVKNFLGSSVNEQMLVQAIKSHGSHTQPHLSGNNVLNDVISLYFDRMESIEKPNKQVRFDEVISV